MAIVALFLGIHFSAAAEQGISDASARFTVTASSPLVDTDEHSLLEDLPRLIPPDVRVATSPVNGSSMAYALFGIPTTTTYLSYSPTPDQTVINTELNQAGRVPDQICPALRALNVAYVLDFGDSDYTGGDHPYPGLDIFSDTPGFTLVEQRGQASLYLITACQ